MIKSTDIENLFNEQLPQWQLARDNYEALNNMRVRHVDIDGCNISIQYNPSRKISVTTNINHCNERPCFLCGDNLPSEQYHIFLWYEYLILVNPYPLFNHHFTIAVTKHIPQRIHERIGHMLQMAESLAPYTIFYNGPHSGASAPMHMHFQAAEGGYMPIEKQWIDAIDKVICNYGDARIGISTTLHRPIFAIEGKKIEEIEVLFAKLYRALKQLPVNQSCEEPMMNILARYENGQYILLVFARAKHRPDCYYATGDEQYIISPGSVEMGGVFITIREEDFTRLTPEIICNIYKQITPSQEDIENVIAHIQKDKL